ncbi:MAG: aminoacetone oxidase family FAD-binding enzyme [Bacteroidales bacterium]|nr:aminoacetone oxidase family FAD-binding enzyme [Bacteroidales bacterium]
MPERNYDFAIIGGGAAGLMAAAWITEQWKSLQAHPSVVLLEKMPRPGRKINITGKGRCNLTNTRMWDEFSPHIHPNPQFAKNAFYNFSTHDTMDFFKSIGLELSVERGQRVFPKSMRAMDVTDALAGCIKRGGVVDLETSARVLSVKKSDLFEILYQDDDACVENLVKARKVLLATGGLSYPSTGSSGDGYTFAKSLGHSIIKCRPSLTALTPCEYREKDGTLSRFGKSLCGLQLKNVAVSLVVNGAVVQEEFGDIDFTDGGIEGSLGFRISRKAVEAMDNGQKISVVLDLKPALSQEQLHQRIKRESSSGNNTLKYLLSRLLPHQMISPFLYLERQLADMQPGKAAALLPQALKNLKFNIASYVGFERCVVTNGGVSLKEVSQKTMESKMVEGLYLAGEVLDLDGDTGGYNLQLAFSTAVLAAKSASEKM